MEELQDIDLKCIDCKALFTFTSGEQKFFSQLHEEGKMQTISAPKRCSDCRKKRKMLREPKPEDAEGTKTGTSYHPPLFKRGRRINQITQ